MHKADIISKQVAIEVCGDMVRIDLIIGDEYAAQVLYEDIIDRMKSGRGIELKLRTSDKTIAIVDDR